MPVTQIESVAGLRDHVGHDVAVSDWLEVSQERINLFAEATEDRDRQAGELVLEPLL